MTELRVSHLKVHYGDLIGVSDVSLRVEAGSIVALPQVGGLYHRYERIAA